MSSVLKKADKLNLSLSLSHYYFVQYKSYQYYNMIYEGAPLYIGAATVTQVLILAMVVAWSIA